MTLENCGNRLTGLVISERQTHVIIPPYRGANRTFQQIIRTNKWWRRYTVLGVEHIHSRNGRRNISSRTWYRMQTKKEGYDFPVTCLLLLMTTDGSIVLHLMNTILFTYFPTSLYMALLSAIPKCGNLRLNKNYRGIQMQPMLANLYDRIICNRLILWAKINP